MAEYTHLNKAERILIEKYNKQGWNLAKIARALNRSRNGIQHERMRGGGKNYSAEKGQAEFDKMSRIKGDKKRRTLTKEQEEKIEEGLRNNWKNEKIANYAGVTLWYVRTYITAHKHNKPESIEIDNLKQEIENLKLQIEILCDFLKTEKGID